MAQPIMPGDRVAFFYDKNDPLKEMKGEVKEIIIKMSNFLYKITGDDGFEYSLNQFTGTSSKNSLIRLIPNSEEYILKE